MIKFQLNTLLAKEGLFEEMPKGAFEAKSLKILCNCISVSKLADSVEIIFINVVI